jgi:prophage antirepressor-like protein
MNELQTFENSEFGQVRTTVIDNEPYFVGKDIAEILGYTNPPKAIRDHIDDEDKLTERIVLSGQKREVIVINESGVYALIFGSKLPKAKEFKHWVTSEVLPSIRRHGAYMTEETLEEALRSPDFLIRLATELKEAKDNNKQLEVANASLTVEKQIMQPKADYFDELVDRNLLTNIRETAKQLEVKQKDFVNFLIDKKYLYRDKRGKLMPYANKNKGLFEIKETFNERTKWSGTQTLVTPKGRETFRLLYLKSS